MARKSKKVVEQTALKGNVKIKVMHGNRLVKSYEKHNEGTLNLFYGLVTCLSGSPAREYLPNYISVGDGTRDPGTSVTTSGLQHELDTMTRVKVTPNFKGPSISSADGSVSTIYQAIIPYSSIGDTTVKELGLFGTLSGSDMVARVQPDEPISLSLNENLIVEWTFTLKNN